MIFVLHLVVMICQVGARFGALDLGVFMASSQTCKSKVTLQGLCSAHKKKDRILYGLHLLCYTTAKMDASSK